MTKYFFCLCCLVCYSLTGPLYAFQTPGTVVLDESGSVRAGVQASASMQGSSGSLTPTGQQLLGTFTPGQQEVIKQEVQKQGGGELTPEAIDAIKNNPEFKGLKPAEVEEGKRLIESLERRGQKQQPSQTPDGSRKKNDDVVSLFRQYLTNKTGALKVSTELRPFGYNLFQHGPAKPIPAQPVAPDYIIGPGDEIQVFVWGRINTQYTLRVGVDGRIMFPQIGPLTVAGMRYEQMEKFLVKQATRITGTDVAITLSRLHQFQVFVLGEVQRPGPYNLTAMTTMLDALIAAGGPTGRGSLRKISLKRENETISVLDLYSLLLNGDKSKDRRLRNGDIVFVPLAGPLVGIAGNVRRPGIYELMQETNLVEALELAGALTPVAWKQMIQVERAEKHAWKKVVDINARDAKNLKQLSLQDGDLIKIFSIIPETANRVELYGNVLRPGTYAWHPGLTLREIIKGPESLQPDSCFDYALIKRAVLPTGGIKLVPFNLARIVLAKGADLELHPLDRIYVFSKWFFESKPTVVIKGKVRKPGTYQIPEKGFRIKDLILQSGGLAKDAYLEKAELYRIDKKQRKRSLVLFDLKKALLGVQEHNLLLKDGDQIIVHSLSEYMPEQTVTIYGEVNKPGTYPFVEGMTVKDLVFAGGNVKDSAYLKEGEVFSYKIINNTLAEYEHRVINLELALSDEPQHNILLHPYDKIFIKKIADWGREKYVEIEGEVIFPGKYLIKKGERLSSLIKRAGGFTKNAYLRGAIFTRERVRKLQQKRLNEMVDKLEQELLSAGSAKTATALTGDESKIYLEESKINEKFLARLREVKAKGRLVIDIKPLVEFKDYSDDVELEDGDKLNIPQNPATVQVLGAVYNQTAFIFRHGKKISGYIDLAGGYSQNADKDATYILKADGSAVRPHKGLTWGFQWNERLNRWERSHRFNIEPGDTIIVPEKLDRIAWLRSTKDITQILFQLAVTTGVIMTTLF